MTSIEQLQVCGIRSFHPDPGRRQTVTFYKPLTVILGKNGAGKTTIIEALLNACTGVMPPGSGTEKSAFVYDPKVLGEAEVKAQIRLIFTGKGGNVMQVIRSFQAMRSRSKVTFTTLDNTVAFLDTATGKVVSNTYRASDVDRVVPEMLGVSPAVLEHVIFCHQEDSNWPLAAPKDVKRIFDDIFAATRYVMALDRLRDNSKELRRQMREHETTLMALREHRDQAQQLQEELARKEAAVREMAERNAHDEPALTQMRALTATLDALERDAAALATEATLLHGRMAEKRDAHVRAVAAAAATTTEDNHARSSPRNDENDGSNSSDGDDDGDKTPLAELQAAHDAAATRQRDGDAAVTAAAQRHDAAQARARRHETRVYELRTQLQLCERAADEQQRHRDALRHALASLYQATSDANDHPDDDSEDARSRDVTPNDDGDDGARVQAALTRARAAVQRRRDAAHAELAAHNARVRDATAAAQTRQRGVDVMAAEHALVAQRCRELEARVQRTAAEAAALDSSDGSSGRSVGDDARSGERDGGCAARLARARATAAALAQRVQAAEAVRRGGARAQQRQALLRDTNALNARVAWLGRTMVQLQQCERAQAERTVLREQLHTRVAHVRTTLTHEVLPRLTALGVRVSASSDDDATAAVATSSTATHHDDNSNNSSDDNDNDADADAMTSLLSRTTARVAEAQRRCEEAQVRAQHELAAAERHGGVVEQRRLQLLDELTDAEAQASACAARCAHALADVDAGNDSNGSHTDKRNDTSSEHVDVDVDGYEAALQRARDTAAALTRAQEAHETMAACYADFVAVARATRACAVCERPFDNDDAVARFVALSETRQRRSPAAAQAAAQAAVARLQRLQAAHEDVLRLRQLRAAVAQKERLVRDLTAEQQSSEARRDACDARHRDAAAAAAAVADVATCVQRLNTLASEAAALRAQLRRVEQLAQQQQQQQRQSSPLRDDVRVEDAGDVDVSDFAAVSRAYDAATAQLQQLNAQLRELERGGDGDGDDDSEGSGSNSLAAQLRRAQADVHACELAASKLADVQATLQRERVELHALHARHDELTAQLTRQRQCLADDATALAAAEAQRAQCEAATHARCSALDAALHHVEAAGARLLEDMRSVAADAADNNDDNNNNSNNGNKETSMAERSTRLSRVREALAAAQAAYDDACAEAAAATRERDAAAAARDTAARACASLARRVTAAQLRDALAADAAALSRVTAQLTALKQSRVPELARLFGDDAVARDTPAQLRERVRARCAELERARALRDGHVEAMLHDVANVRAQLGKDKYHDVERRYRAVFLKLHTTEMAAKDIDKYYGALEKAVQSYHQEKIAQVNELIAELWRQTYRGSDIDVIEICSEADAMATSTAGATSSSTTTSASGRRSYNYRVVMKRGGSAIDMRGRCSAGQRVLASVIIRLALSEAFCCDCGILALDEPTTNLDEGNARSLAEALHALIEARRAVKHFQLIIITHDEQFVRALGGHALERFYYVHKDREGAFSVIDERTFDQLFA